MLISITPLPSPPRALVSLPLVLPFHHRCGVLSSFWQRKYFFFMCPTSSNVFSPSPIVIISVRAHTRFANPSLDIDLRVRPVKAAGGWVRQRLRLPVSKRKQHTQHSTTTAMVFKCVHVVESRHTSKNHQVSLVIEPCAQKKNTSTKKRHHNKRKEISPCYFVDLGCPVEHFQESECCHLEPPVRFILL